MKIKVEYNCYFEKIYIINKKTNFFFQQIKYIKNIITAK